MARGLTPKQQRFVEEYLVDLNSSAAARRAGYTGDANTIGPRLLANVGVSQQIAAGRKRLSESTQRTIADAMADIRRRGQMAEDEGEWGPAIKAAELEAKHLGAFVERLEHTGPGGGPLQSVSLTPAEFARIAAEVAGRV
jgi:phage terminase small subunit